ncbi:lipoprotein [Streptococcus parasanguinis FW213]|uniref:Lipoprotein n=3 Tax=Streptococcus parasanguinis TaxID=1318 RepID=I1ZPS5_STRPA|nr:lipoprotein [Streptococcus parasanguinis FW213]
MIGGLMKSRKIMLTIASIAVLLNVGGCTVKQKDDTKQGKTIAASSTKYLKEDEETIKKKQLDYLKEHEQEIVDLVKAQNSKVESVQIDWDQTQWSDGGLTTPEYYMNVYGCINHIEESSWRVDIPINEDNTLNLDEMYIGSDIRVGGRLFE